MTVDAPPARDRVGSRPGCVEDPLGRDDPADAAVTTTRRALCRVAIVAAEVGQRFQREALSQDPVGWMLAPRRLFGGEIALDACLDRDHFSRALLLHGLSLGLDAEPAAVDALVAGGEPDVVDPGTCPADSVGPEPDGTTRLWALTSADGRERHLSKAFNASLRRPTTERVNLLSLRFGADGACTGNLQHAMQLAASFVTPLVGHVVSGFLPRVEVPLAASARRRLGLTIGKGDLA